MSAQKKARIGQPRSNTQLDRLAQHPDPRVRLFTGQFVAYQRPPADAPRLRAALQRLERGLTDLASSRPRIGPMAGRELVGLRLTTAALTAMDAHGGDHPPTEAWLKQFKIYGALLLVVEDDLPALRALAAEYLRGVYTGHCTHANVADTIRLRSRSPFSAESSREPACPWEARYAATVQHLEDLYVNDAEVLAARFQEAACSSFIWKAKRPGRLERPGLIHHRTLTLAALADAFDILRMGIEARQPLEVGIAAGYLSGLPWGLSQEIPLAKPDGDDWVIWLDVKGGCLHLNLNPVVRGAASAKGNRKYVLASRAFRRFLPSTLAEALQFLLTTRQTSSTLGVLCATADVPPEHVLGQDDGRVSSSAVALLLADSATHGMRLYTP
jgi:hypothetical protein